MSTLAAVVKSPAGQVFAVSVEGFKRQIFEGEHLLQGENDGNILDYLRVEVDAATLTSTLQISTTGPFGQGAAADTTITLEGVDLNPGNLGHADLVGSLSAGSDPTIRVDYS